jgi:hypothetical protein
MQSSDASYSRRLVAVEGKGLLSPIIIEDCCTLRMQQPATAKINNPGSFRVRRIQLKKGFRPEGLVNEKFMLHQFPYSVVSRVKKASHIILIAGKHRRSVLKNTHGEFPSLTPSTLLLEHTVQKVAR